MTHWAYTDLLPLVGATHEKARVVKDGNVITGGGVTAGIDFGLSVIAEIASEDPRLEKFRLRRYKNMTRRHHLIPVILTKRRPSSQNCYPPATTNSRQCIVRGSNKRLHFN